MKSTKVQNPRRKSSAVVAEYRIPYRVGPRTIITHAHRAPLIDGLGWVTQRGRLVATVTTSHRLASCVIVSGFRAALDLNNPFNSKFSFTPCRLHPASNGNSISESHPEYEGHAHHYVITITSLQLRHPEDQMEARALYRALLAIRRPHAGRHLALVTFVHPT